MKKLLAASLLLTICVAVAQASEIGTFLNQLIGSLCDSCQCCDFFNEWWS